MDVLASLPWICSTGKATNNWHCIYSLRNSFKLEWLSDEGVISP
jgi:hypothetical protein